MSDFYDKQGKPLSLMEWAKKFEEIGYKRVGMDITTYGYRVSTVWLGLDHNYSRGKPLIFETMVFHDKKGKLGHDYNMERYSTLKEAKEGHKKMVKKWSKKRG